MALTLLELIDRYAESYPEERDVYLRLRSFVESVPDCCERTHLAGHVTGSAWLVDSTGSKVLLTHHRKLNRWLQLGGHADGDRDILRVALREAQEESGIQNIRAISEDIFDIDIHPIPARGKEPEHLHYDIRFALQVLENDSFIVSEESHSLAWIEIDRLEEYSSEESMLRMKRKWNSTQTKSALVW